MARLCMAASGMGSLTFIDDGTPDGSSRMNSDRSVYRLMPHQSFSVSTKGLKTAPHKRHHTNRQQLLVSSHKKPQTKTLF